MRGIQDIQMRKSYSSPSLTTCTSVCPSSPLQKTKTRASTTKAAAATFMLTQTHAQFGVEDSVIHASVGTMLDCFSRFDFPDDLLREQDPPPAVAADAHGLAICLATPDDPSVVPETRARSKAVDERVAERLARLRRRRNQTSSHERSPAS